VENLVEEDGQVRPYPESKHQCRHVGGLAGGEEIAHQLPELGQNLRVHDLGPSVSVVGVPHHVPPRPFAIGGTRGLEVGIGLLVGPLLQTLLLLVLLWLLSHVDDRLRRSKERRPVSSERVMLVVSILTW
jgi:hypothetical protein